MYLYLNNLNLKKEASLLGSLVFIFSGFFIAWGWWGNIIHTLIWLPLLLLCIDKISYYIIRENSKCKMQNAKPQFKIQNLIICIKQFLTSQSVNQTTSHLATSQFLSNPQPATRQPVNSLTRQQIIWSIIFIISLCSSFFAGHLQVFFYVFLTTLIYIIVKFITNKNNQSKLIKFIAFCLLLVALITSVQWKPTLDFINQSARALDQSDWQKVGWFIPWQNLVQFIVPDFFGNPATGNYWGVWNYGEFIGYIGILPLILAIYALIFRKDKKTLFFGSLFFLSLIFALPTPLAKLPYILKLPLIATSQPTRLLLITDFSLVILCALGLDYLMKEKQIKNILKIIISLGLIFLCLWLFVMFGKHWLSGADWLNNLTIAKRNLVYPTIILFINVVIVLMYSVINNIKLKYFILYTLYLILIIDLFRFGWKFLPFMKEEYIYPKTKTIQFLQNKQKEGRFRIMATDERILPPNFSIMYKIESVDGYDPLFLKSYADLINKMEVRELNSSFNRIITPKNYESPITDLLNVRYVISLNELSSPKLKKVYQEGETRVYENLKYVKQPYFENTYAN